MGGQFTPSYATVLCFSEFKIFFLILDDSISDEKNMGNKK